MQILNCTQMPVWPNYYCRITATSRQTVVKPKVKYVLTPQGTLHYHYFQMVPLPQTAVLPVK